MENECVMRKVTYPTVQKNMYMISNDGRLYNLRSEKFVKPFIHNSGYYYVNVKPDPEKYPDRYSITIQIHRLVAWEFVPNPNNYPFVDHIDGNKLNNYDTNLDWVTGAENIRRASNNNLMNGICYGEKKAREVCELLQQGYSSLHIYRLLLNDPKAKIADDPSLYMFVDRIRRKKVWVEISDEYDFYTGKQVRRASNNNTLDGCCKYSEELIRDICSYLEQGWDAKKIYFKYKPNDKSIDDDGGLYSLIQGLRRREIWDYITKDYKYTMQTTTARPRLEDSEAYNLFCKGYSLDEVKRILGVISIGKTPKEYRRVMRAKERYEMVNNIGDNEDIYIKEN